MDAQRVAAVLQTARLRLEPLSSMHVEGMVALHADPEVMRFLGAGRPLARATTLNMVDTMRGRWETQGYGWWGLVHLQSWAFVGAAAVHHLDHDPDKPLELAWRIHRQFWKQGYASEAAREIARFAFEQLGRTELYAVARAGNAASIRVMEKLGMSYVGVEHHWGEDLPTYVLRR